MGRSEHGSNEARGPTVAVNPARAMLKTARPSINPYSSPVQCIFIRIYNYGKHVTRAVAVLHICICGGSRGGVGCARGGTKSFHIYRV